MGGSGNVSELQELMLFRSAADPDSLDMKYPPSLLVGDETEAFWSEGEVCETSCCFQEVGGTVWAVSMPRRPGAGLGFSGLSLGDSLGDRSNLVGHLCFGICPSDSLEPTLSNLRPGISKVSCAGDVFDAGRCFLDVGLATPPPLATLEPRDDGDDSRKEGTA